MLFSRYGMLVGTLNVVRSLGWDPRYHEEIRNGPENKIHIRKVRFRSLGKIPMFSSEVLEGSRRFIGPKVEWSMNVSWVNGMIGSYPRSLGVDICERELKL